MTKIRVVWALTAKNEVALAPDKIFENSDIEMNYYYLSCGMTLLQAGSKAHYNIITPLAKDAIKEYEKSLAKWQWSYGTAKPVYPTRKEESIFRLTIRNQWQGLAYMMLFVADLPLLAAFKARNKLYFVILSYQQKLIIPMISKCHSFRKTCLYIIGYMLFIKRLR